MAGEGIRVTTWNVNGIRNPFSYQPWLELKTYAAMFETLKADIIVFQELKIQKRDLTDDMVLVPGWDCYFTFPKHKKGYSGVAIYTRQSKISPIKAEEGITGILPPPGSTCSSYLSLPHSEQIGGYPHLSRDDAILLDSEGRALVLDLGAFVLIGTYCPANRDSSRDDFRHEFVRTLFERCRNLIAMGRRVVLMGDLNIARDEIDAAHARETMKRLMLTDFKDTPIRQMFHRFLKPHEEGVMLDLCREFWPDRRGMYTCWEQRVQARPGNYGARIDYVLCSTDMKSWFSEANIQEGLMGSDHCPVYAVLKPIIRLYNDQEQVHIVDLLNPRGMFINGIGQPDSHASKTYQQPRLSGRLLPEFGPRRSIRDMFSKKPPPTTVGTAATKVLTSGNSQEPIGGIYSEGGGEVPQASRDSKQPESPLSLSADSDIMVGQNNKLETFPAPAAGKRSAGSSQLADAKRSRLSTRDTKSKVAGTVQSRLSGFFKPQSATSRPIDHDPSKLESIPSVQKQGPSSASGTSHKSIEKEAQACEPDEQAFLDASEASGSTAQQVTQQSDEASAHIEVHDPIVVKESWSKLFTKKQPPRCQGHDEPCKQLITKKPGPNCGRAFWICARPIGPEGEIKSKDQKSEWRCNFFKWSSDWTG